MKTKKQEIRQRIMATIVVFFMGVMVFGSMEVNDLSAATGLNTTLIQNFVAGTLQLEAPSSAAFNDLTIGVAADSYANLDVINMKDYTGSGAGWTVSGSMNDLTAVNIGTNTISNKVISWIPGTHYALGGASNTGVAVGSETNFFGIRTLINTSTNNGLGSYRVNGTVLNVAYNGLATQVAGTYQNQLTLTMQ